VIEPMNLLIVMSDEYAANAVGCYGHPIVRTPNIDRLAKGGARFTNAYTPSPICMPARAAFATGLYPHETGFWCNASPYAGNPISWGHCLQDAGIPILSIGKLHYQDELVSTGFDESRIPMHAQDGVGDLHGAVRQIYPLPERAGSIKVSQKLGGGESNYTRYDRAILADSLDWLENVAPRQKSPWVLFSSFLAPHFPLIAPEDFFRLYPVDEMPLPKLSRPGEHKHHPWFEEQIKSYTTDRFFTDEKRRLAVASYYGLCSFVDHNLGCILDMLEKTGLDKSTRIVFVSDHGESLGARRLWWKSNFYQEVANIPLLMAGPGIPEGIVVETPVSLVDFFPTVFDAVGVTPKTRLLESRPGTSLFRAIEHPHDRERMVFCEYHGAGAISGAYMLRQGAYKYVHYVGYPAQLFNLDNDPQELVDLGAAPNHAAVLNHFECELRKIVDPEGVDRRAKAQQAQIVERHGGREAILSKGQKGGGTDAPKEFAPAS
jgi:choline-sulfatase